MSDIKTLDCGCEVIVATNGSVMLTYCPLHKAAPDLYEALRELSVIVECGEHHKGKELDNAFKALAKAEGK